MGLEWKMDETRRIEVRQNTHVTTKTRREKLQGIHETNMS